MDKETWIVVGNLCWGKADNFKEALFNMLENDSATYPTKTITILRLGCDPSKVTMDELNGVAYPQGTPRQRLDKVPLPPAAKRAFVAWSYWVDGFPDEIKDFYKVFID